MTVYIPKELEKDFTFIQLPVKVNYYTEPSEIKEHTCVLVTKDNYRDIEGGVYCLWTGVPDKIPSDYLISPYDLLRRLSFAHKPLEPQWLNLLREIQSLAQAGIAYTRDVFDEERFERIRHLTSQLVGLQIQEPDKEIYDLFSLDSGYQTPKVDVRGVVFRKEKILLTQEISGMWVIPGGWMDVGLSVRENVMKEVKEEAGKDVIPRGIISLMDRNYHNTWKSLISVLKIFVLCEEIGGEFEENIETLGIGYFGFDELPTLDTRKTSVSQIHMCFEAYRSNNWKVLFD